MMKEFKTGDRVSWCGKEWLIESPVSTNNIITNYTLARLDYDEMHGYQLEHAYASAECLIEITHEMTASEYANALYVFFQPVKRGVPKRRGLDEICGEMRCHQCPLGIEHLRMKGIESRCTYMIRYMPVIALDLINEWKANHNKPTRKSYFNDFLEKCLNALIDQDEGGVPVACRQYIYNVKCPSAGTEMTCADCWNQEMPEGEDGQ